MSGDIGPGHVRRLAVFHSVTAAAVEGASGPGRPQPAGCASGGRGVVLVVGRVCFQEVPQGTEALGFVAVEASGAPPQQ